MYKYHSEPEKNIGFCFNKKHFALILLKILSSYQKKNAKQVPTEKIESHRENFAKQREVEALFENITK